MPRTSWRFIFILGFFVTTGLAAKEYESITNTIAKPTSLSELRLRIHNNLKLTSKSSSSEDFKTSVKPRSVGKAVLFSAIIPGTGQFYNKSIIKGAVFLVVEAVALTGHFYYQNQGTDLENEFEDFADMNWDEDVYWDWIWSEAQMTNPDILRDDMNALREYERGRFSHFLPENRNQQYYENIGKYDQFNIGWVDTETGGGRDSVFRESYTLLRKDANDNFKRATTFATVALLNHLISAVEAGLSAKKYNSKLKADVGLKGIIHQRDIVPTLALDIRW